jgi:hypothetical protein
MGSGAQVRQRLAIGSLASPLSLEQWGIPDIRRGRRAHDDEAQSCWHKACGALYRRMLLMRILEFVGNVTL